LFLKRKDRLPGAHWITDPMTIKDGRIYVSREVGWLRIDGAKPTLRREDMLHCRFERLGRHWRILVKLRSEEIKPEATPMHPEEAALHAVLDKLECLLEFIPDGAVIVSSTGLLAHLNEHGHKLHWRGLRGHFGIRSERLT
jgi:hypothetical protein